MILPRPKMRWRQWQSRAVPDVDYSSEVYSYFLNLRYFRS